ncbi:hypothetical protein PS850_01486 [Pseudomonas fluorescens]|nr:hypothetical protein PS850_01486 [Pseudomonas fluorescens]
MVVNDDAGNLTPRVVLGFFASELAPTLSPTFVGASLLAMVVNDDAGNLAPRAVLGFFASELAPTVLALGQAPFIQMNGAFVRKKECFSTTHGIMRAVMIIFERTRRATC